MKFLWNKCTIRICKNFTFLIINYSIIFNRFSTAKQIWICLQRKAGLSENTKGHLTLLTLSFKPINQENQAKDFMLYKNRIFILSLLQPHSFLLIIQGVSIFLAQIKNYVNDIFCCCKISYELYPWKNSFFFKKKIAFNVLTNKIPPKQHLIKLLQILIKVKHLEMITFNSSVLLVLCYLNHKVFRHILRKTFLQFNPCILLKLCFAFSPCRIVTLCENNIT